MDSILNGMKLVRILSMLVIAHFLEPDSVTFDDCQVSVEKTSIAWLKEYASATATAA